jgi:hypothetical protein
MRRELGGSCFTVACWIQGWKDGMRLMEFGAASKLYIGDLTSRRRVSRYVLGVNKLRQVVAAHGSCSLQIFSNTAVRTVVEQQK